MDKISKRVHDIYQCFSKKTRGILQREYCEKFAVVPNTFYNKMSKSKTSRFALEELWFFEDFARRHGMPLKNEETEELTKQSA